MQEPYRRKQNVAALLTSADAPEGDPLQGPHPSGVLPVSRFAGDLVRIGLRSGGGCWPQGARLGFLRKDREPAVVLRTPRLGTGGRAVLYSWVPKAAESLCIVDVAGKPWSGEDIAVVSLRTVPLVELGLRALFRFPRKLLAVARLFLAGNHRGVAFRFARLADELNALPYSRWLENHLRANDVKPLPSSNTVILVTLEASSHRQRTATMRSLDAQTWPRWQLAERSDLNTLRASDPMQPKLWLNLPAGAILAKNALERLAEPFGGADVAAVYADEDRISAFGWHHEPCFKPAWSPLLAQSGWLPLDGALVKLSALPPDFNLHTADMVEAVSAIAAEMPGSVLHLPQMLISRRARYVRKRRPQKAPATAKPRVSVIVPIRDRPDLLRACIGGLLDRTIADDLDIIIVDNDSREPETLTLLDEVVAKGIARTVAMPGAFNFSRACNLGVEAARNDLILLMNNDVDPISDDWLVQMAAELVDETVGAVGAYLFYPDGFVQHAGVTLGAGSVARHSFAFLHPDGAEDRGLLFERRDVSAVTAACLLTTRAAWSAVGGMDEDHLQVAFNDVDYCLKLRRSGKRIVWTPDARLWHHESVSRGKDDTAGKLKRFAHEEAIMFSRWGTLLRNDPFHNPNLSKVAEDFVLETFPVSLAARSAGPC